MTMEKQIRYGNRMVIITQENDHPVNRMIDDNNLECRQDDGTLLWEVGSLLRKFSINNGLKYYYDLYCGLQKVDNTIVRCIGNINHCYIDVFAEEIVRIENNR